MEAEWAIDFLMMLRIYHANSLLMLADSPEDSEVVEADAQQLQVVEVEELHISDICPTFDLRNFGSDHDTAIHCIHDDLCSCVHACFVIAYAFCQMVSWSLKTADAHAHADAQDDVHDDHDLLSETYHAFHLDVSVESLKMTSRGHFFVLREDVLEGLAIQLFYEQLLAT